MVVRFTFYPSWWEINSIPVKKAMGVTLGILDSLLNSLTGASFARVSYAPWDRTNRNRTQGLSLILRFASFSDYYRLPFWVDNLAKLTKSFRADSKLCH